MAPGPWCGVPKSLPDADAQGLRSAGTGVPNDSVPMVQSTNLPVPLHAGPSVRYTSFIVRNMPTSDQGRARAGVESTTIRETT